MSNPVVDYVTDWPARLRSRLYKQFKDDPTWIIWCNNILGPQFQALEDAAQGLLALLNLTDAIGAQLDLIGRIVGQPRAGLDDDTYRLYLQARIAANRSDGGPNAIYLVFSLLFPGQQLTLQYSPIRSFILTIAGALTTAQATTALAFLGDTKSAGVRAILQTQSLPDSGMFTCGITATLRAPSSTSLLLANYAKFPPSGTVQLDAGGGVTDDGNVTNSAISPTGVMTLTTGLADSYPIGSTVELVTDPGLGFGDASNPATGGEFSSAAQAA